MLAVSACGIHPDLAGAERTYQGSSQPIEDRYAELRQAAIVGDADDKLEAFFYVYEHLSELKSTAPEALQFLADAAARGNAEAQYNLGFLMQTGTLVKQDEERALPLLLLAAQQDYVPAQVWAGLNFLSRYFDAPEEERQLYFKNSERWLLQVRSNSTSEEIEWLVATEALGRLYLGEDCTRDEGVQMLEQASTGGYKPATKTLDQFGDLIEKWNNSDKEIAEACH